MLMPEACCSGMRLAKSTITAAASTCGVPPWWLLEMQVRSASTVVATRWEYAEKRVGLPGGPAYGRAPTSWITAIAARISPS